MLLWFLIGALMIGFAFVWCGCVLRWRIDAEMIVLQP
jgi:hypothetical protein